MRYFFFTFNYLLSYQSLHKYRLNLFKHAVIIMLKFLYGHFITYYLVSLPLIQEGQ